MLPFFRHYASSLIAGTLLSALLVVAAGGTRLYHHALSLTPWAVEHPATIAAISTQADATTAPLPATPPETPAVPVKPQTKGSLDTPQGESITGREFIFSGWVFDPSGIRAVEIRFPGQTYTATLNVARDDVRERLALPPATQPGFEARITLPEDFQAIDRQPADIVALTSDGREFLLGKRSWLPELPRQPLAHSNKRIFYFLMMASGIHLGGGNELDTIYTAYQSPYFKTGLSVPILYMRTTKGPQGDWAFDPAFDLKRRCDDRLVTEDSLEDILAFSIEKKIPIQLILNGGIWGDASCTFSEWDLTDLLEQDPMLCQWSQDNSIYPDDYLSNLPGSTESPRLARSLTYHIYAKKNRDYKKRNLQAAAHRVARFAHEHPDLFVGVALDADTYMNPFFDRRATFDYNPGMLRQFREWLQGTGPYAGKTADPSVPDLSAYRRTQKLTLDEINTIAGKHWKRWDDVDPPRPSPALLMSSDGDKVLAEVWENRWWQLWDAFRKHIVHLHYTELAQWAADAGIPQDRIFSAQGFAAKGLTFPSVLIEEKGPFNHYDSAGVSIEGAKPHNRAHLGAVTYSKPARNDVAMQHGHSLFSEFARIDDGWGVVEYNAADIDDARTPPQYQNAYGTYRDLYNFDAQEVSHMAWNGSNGLFADDPGYVSYTSFRNTGTEEAMRDFMVSHAFFPESLRLWTFGSARYASVDGWTALTGTLEAGKGYLQLSPDKDVNKDSIEIDTPVDQILRTERLSMLSLIVPTAQQRAIVQVAIYARQQAGASWQLLVADAMPTITPFAPGFSRLNIPLHWPPSWRKNHVIAEQLKLRLTLASDSPAATPLQLHRVSLQ